MSRNLERDYDSRPSSNKAKDSKVSLKPPASSNQTSIKTTSGSSQIDRQTCAQYGGQTLSHQAGEQATDPLLRGIGHWVSLPHPRYERTAELSSGGDDLLGRSTEEQSTTKSSREGGRSQELSPMERFRAERRRDEPFGHLDHSIGGSQHAPSRGD